MKDCLTVVGARQHNLANLTCEIPRNQLVVVTGPSGSGKSSLAFDTVFAESQRRYVESLSAYARQFLDQFPRPDVDSIEGLSPAIAVAQDSGTPSPRSTLGTTTELSDYLRLLFARCGVAHCPVGGEVLVAYTAQQIVDEVLAEPLGTKVVLLARVVERRVGSIADEVEQLRRQGYVRAQVNGQAFELSDGIPAEYARGEEVGDGLTLDVVIDRVVVREGLAARLTDSVELSLRVGRGSLLLHYPDRGTTWLKSELFRCATHHVELPKLEPRLFSFNSPLGACNTCQGLGVHASFSADLVVPNRERSLRQGAIVPLGTPGSVAFALALNQLVKALKLDPDLPWSKLEPELQQRILYGAPASGRKAAFEGVLPPLERRLSNADASDGSDFVEEEGTFPLEHLPRLQRKVTCSTCRGARLNASALAVRFGGHNFADVSRLSLLEFQSWLESQWAAAVDDEVRVISRPLLTALQDRVGFLLQVGLGYLTLERPSQTLSGGETQRIRLATQLGAKLVGVLYVLDEPSVGLHPHDNQRLLDAIRSLVTRGNSVLLVEHDRDSILAADHVLDIGPGAGPHGGRIVAQGSPETIRESRTSVTGAFLRFERSLSCEARATLTTSEGLEIRNARTHNLQDVSARIPYSRLCAVTGPSGSGKSSLIFDTLLPLVNARLLEPRSSQVQTGEDSRSSLLGLDERIERVIQVDQAPIGRTPRSNPATYTGLFPLVRELFASLPDARARGYQANRFSFNVKGGRCESCKGDGLRRIEMQFLPDVYVRCSACEGRRYNRETLEIRYRGLDISQILELDVDAALSLFANLPKLAQRLSALSRLGLGYLRLGQSATTLSGGEAQRLKLATELAKPGAGKTLYVLDEPTTGLHFSDIQLLLQALVELRDAGNTLVVVEHNIELIACCDWVLDLGPEGGDRGGRLVTAGTPREVAQHPSSHTGRFLRSWFSALEQNRA